MPFVTIFTPSFNRKHTLPTLYKSLKEQSDKDFEWVIVDDGSTDDTDELIKSYIDAGDEFLIRYIYQNNAGKMQAVNKGITLAKGKMFFIVDSDDYLPSDAIALIKETEQAIVDKNQFAGIAGCKYYTDDTIVGQTFSGEYIDATSLERKKFNITGDKAEVFYTDVIKKFPFPVFEGEKFIPEALVFNRIANDGYKFRWFNKNIYYCEYLDDGYSKNIDKLLINNWKGYSLYYRELMSSHCDIREKIVPTLGYIYRFIKRTIK